MMPLYEYTCTNCGCIFDKLRRVCEIKDPIGCPRCREINMNPKLNIKPSYIYFPDGLPSDNTPDIRFESEIRYGDAALEDF